MTTSDASDTVASMPRLASLLGVEPSEGTTLSLMVTLAFVLAASFVLVQTTAYGLFINEFGAHELPLAYLSIAFLSSLIAYLYLRLSAHLAYRTVLFVNLAFLVLMCVLFWVGLRSTLAHWFIFFLPFWFQTLVNLANLIVWPLAGRVFNVRQAKRLFGVVGAGTWAANLLGGFVIAPILTRTSTPNLYLLAAAALVLAGPVLWVISKRHLAASEAALDRSAEPAHTVEASASSIFRNPYSRLILAYVLLWWLSFCFIDNIFFDRAELQYPTGTQLAGFIGQQLSVMGLIAIITTMFLTARIVGRFGLRAALLVMPLVTTVSIVVLAFGGTLGMPTALLFWIAAIAKTFNVSLGFSLSQATGTLLYQPLLGHQRHSTETIAEGIVQPVAVGMAGLILLLATNALHFNAIGLSYLFLVIAALWFWAILGITREYPKALSEALKKRSLGESTNLLFDPEGLRQLQHGLRSPRPGVVLYALNQIEQLEPRTCQRALQRALPRLMAHPAPEVRREALGRLLSFRQTDALSLVRARLREESVPEVYSVLIQALAALGDTADEPQIAEALNSPARIVRNGAIVGLLASASLQQIARARAILQQMVDSRASDDRAAAAGILAETHFHGSKELVSKLLADEAISVRKAAMVAAGCHDDRDLLDKVVSACDNRETAPAAERVLVSKGAMSLAPISDGLLSQGVQPVPRNRLISLFRVLGKINDERALDLLRSGLNTPDPEIRLSVLRSLSAHNFRARPKDGIRGQIQNEIESAAWIAGAMQTVEDAKEAPRLQILKEALESAFGEVRSRVLLLLSFVYDARAVLRAEQALQEKTASRLAFAAETVDSLLPVRLRPLVLPLLEKASHGRRLRLWQTAGLRVSPPSLEALIGALVGAGSESKYSTWTRVCAIHAAGMLGMKSCVPALEDLSSAPDPGLSQSSEWSLARLRTVNSAQGAADMLSLVEKVLILKSANLFSETPDNVLADIAGLAEEILADKDQIIFHKGEAGDSLYIIVTGAVRVLDGSRVLNKLGEGDIFGELALLDPEPRVATVKAVEATHLLRLAESHFRVILAERPEVSSAIIRVITRYLRSLLRGAGEFDPNLTASGSHRPLQPASEAST